MSDTTGTEIKVQPSSGVPLIMNIFRQLGIIAGGCALIAAMIGKRDLAGFIALMQGDQLAPMAAALVFVSASLGSLWKTAHNEWIKRTLADEVSDDLARVQAHGPAKLIIAIIAALGLTSCATIGSGASPAQKLFEARGYYNVVKAAAVDYAESPTADRRVVREIAHIRDLAQPSVDYVDAYVACRAEGQATARIRGVVDPVDCRTFNFSAASISGAAIALRTAATQILAKTGGK